MLSCGKSSSRIHGLDALDLGRLVGAAVLAQDGVVEALDAERQARHADVADRLELRAGERARLALERDLLGAVPRQRGAHARRQLAQLLGADERGRAAAEVDEAQRPSGHRRQLGVALHLARQGVEVGAHVVAVLVGEDPEVAELAALAAERDVQVEARASRRRPAAGAARRSPPGPRRRSRTSTAGSWRRRRCRPASPAGRVVRWRARRASCVLPRRLRHRSSRPCRRGCRSPACPAPPRARRRTASRSRTTTPARRSRGRAPGPRRRWWRRTRARRRSRARSRCAPAA